MNLPALFSQRISSRSFGANIPANERKPRLRPFLVQKMAVATGAFHARAQKYLATFAAVCNVSSWVSLLM